MRRIEQVQHTILASAKEQIAARQDRKSRSAEIFVTGVEGRLVRGREEVDQAHPRSTDAELEQRITEAASAVPLSVPGREIGVASGVDRRRAASLPDSTSGGVGADAENPDLRQRRR